MVTDSKCKALINFLFLDTRSTMYFFLTLNFFFKVKALYNLEIMLGRFWYDLIVEIVTLCDQLYPPSTVPSLPIVKNKLSAFPEAMWIFNVLATCLQAQAEV